MDKSCDDLMSTINQELPKFARDVWDAEFIRTFKGPRSHRLFVDRGNEGRYLFAINIDFINVEGMRIRGASNSCGLITGGLLDGGIRYKPENMYIGGIILGPCEPSLTRVNHFIRPMITHFYESWEREVHFSHTATHPNGRVTRCALAAAVMDLKAARGTTGLGQNKHDCHCSVCRCRGKGVRYSEFYHLEYWDPTRQIVVDVMHNGLEGNAVDHFRHVLSLTKESAESKPTPPPAFYHKFTTIKINDPPLPYDMSEKEAMFDSSVTLLCRRLDSKNTRALKCVCSDLKLVPFKPNVPVDQVLGYYKKDWIQCLLEWVSIRCTSIYFYWYYSRSEKANPIHLQVDISPNSLLPNLCDESKMLSKILQFHRGSIQCLTTTAMLLPGLWNPTNGRIWPQ